MIKILGDIAEMSRAQRQYASELKEENWGPVYPIGMYRYEYFDVGFAGFFTFYRCICPLPDLSPSLVGLLCTDVYICIDYIFQVEPRIAPCLHDLGILKKESCPPCP